MTKDNNFNMKAVYGIATTRVNCSMYVLQQKIIKRLKEFKPLLFNGKTEFQGQKYYEDVYDKIISMTDEELMSVWEHRTFESFMKKIKETPFHFTQNGANQNR